jgi:hypothetical protein
MREFEPCNEFLVERICMLRRGHDSSNIAVRLAISHSGNSNIRVTILYPQEERLKDIRVVIAR